MPASASDPWILPPDGPPLTRPSASSTRRTLRAEKTQLARWRRLVRARLDLAVASFAPPDHVGAMSWDILPEAQLALPMPQELLAAVTVDPPSDPVALMERLRRLDRMLAAYGAELDAALDELSLDGAPGAPAVQTARPEGVAGAR
ncbi:hypothetical protein ICW40_13300 [Actinotalea ferrariae]|uniref:hypothetical protein n=1 Tax=Actinotalea ferrariae TaxID=1386098 RepID=UPI001C8C54DD|nr:hypothetical protein [Actinotalea ferrariae]MBX9245779.1 hypothetical protein [Actinotalea ferrariae]